MDKVIVTYNDQEIEVDKAIADYFEVERKREQAEAKSDSRHLSDKDIERNDIDGFFVDKPDDFVDEIANTSEVEYILRALELLSETQRRRVQKYFFKELTYEQIAAVEGVSKQNVYKSVREAIAKLKTFLSE